MERKLFAAGVAMVALSLIGLGYGLVPRRTLPPESVEAPFARLAASASREIDRVEARLLAGRARVEVWRELVLKRREANVFGCDVKDSAEAGAAAPVGRP